LFDPRRTLLSEASTSPDAHWWTISLVTAVRGLLTWTPIEPLVWPSQAANPEQRLEASSDARLEAFVAATSELTRRGLDAESLVRYGMPNEIAAALGGLLLLRDLGLEEPDLAQRRDVDLEAWRAALPPLKLETSERGVSARRLGEIAMGYARTYVPAIFSWIASAPLTSLAMLSPPEGSQLAHPHPGFNGDSKVRERYAWLVDRFSTSSIRGWLTTSLQYEFRWQDGTEPPPCPLDCMIEREVDKDELNAELARRSAHSIGGDPDPQTVLASEVDSHARNLVTQGRHHEAAALFEFAVLRRPYDADVRNNLGFCLIPENPRAALKELEAAAHMGYDHPAVNVYNRACCYLALEQPRAAMVIAEEYWTSATLPEINGAMLWQWPPEPDWALTQVDEPNGALADLMARLASNMGWQEAQLRWNERSRPFNARSELEAD
jgi:hypothetical protein